MLPGDFSGAGAQVGEAREREQQIRQSVEINDDYLRNFDFALQLNDASLRTTTNRPGLVSWPTVLQSW